MTMRHDMLRELRTIERRDYSEPLDYTRAAVLRASIRSVDIDEAREALRVAEGLRFV